MSERILVTGGAGFVGSNLTGRLLNEGNEVIVVDNLWTGRLENIEPFLDNPNFSFIKHDVTDPLTLKDGLDKIYNLASPASPPIYQADPLRTLNTNILGARNMLELAKEKNARILQASTSEVYGDPLVHPQPETYWGNVNLHGPRACYDEGKRAAEVYFGEYHRAYNVGVRIIRIFNTYGPRMNPVDGRVVSNFIVQALKSEDLTIHGTGNQTRSFQYIDDLVEGMVRMMDQDELMGPVNIGNPGEFSINELASKVREQIPESKSEVVYHARPKDDPEMRRPDISVAEEKLGWKPTIALDEGLAKTIAYFREELEKDEVQTVVLPDAASPKLVTV